MMNKSILAWHFSDGELRFDYSGVKVEAGLVLETEEKPIIGREGFHASVKARDALSWFSIYPAEKIIVSRVRLSGEIVEGSKGNSYGERLSAQKCEHLWIADARDTIENFALDENSWVLQCLNKLSIETVTNSRINELLALRKKWYNREISYELAQNLVRNFRQASKLDKDALLQAFQISHLPAYITDSFLLMEGINLFLYDIADGIPEYLLSGITREPQFFALRASEFTTKFKQLRIWSTKIVKGSVDRESLGKLNDFSDYLDTLPIYLDTNRRLHEMLMRLAPEGYEE